MALFGKKTKVNDSSAEKAEATKTAKVTKKTVAKASAKTEKAIAPVKKSGKAESETVTSKREAAVQGVTFARGSAVIKPRVTEKAGLLSQDGVYTFDVRVDSSASTIAKAIEEAYKVTVVRVSTAPVKSKAMFARGKAGRTVAGKKAYVWLKDGDTIEFI